MIREKAARDPGTGFCRLIFILVLFGLLPGGSAANRLAPEMLDPADPAWADLLRLEISGALPAGITSMRPVTRGEVAEWIVAAADRPDADRLSLARLRRSFARELRRIDAPTDIRETRPLIRRTVDPGEGGNVLDGARTEMRVGPTLALQARGGDGKEELGDSTRVGLYGVVLFGRTAAIQGELFIGEIEDGRKIGDALIKGTDILYYAEEIGAAVTTREARIRLARGRHHWGPGAGPSLLLDAHARPISCLEYDLTLPAGLRFRSWVGSLNLVEDRGVAAHRLEIAFGRNLRVAIAEGVRFPGGPEHPLYLLGLVPYTLVQRYDERDNLVDSLQARQRNNILATAEVVWRPRSGSLVYSEILVDDIPAETAESPARLGGRIGIAILPRIGGEPIEIRLEGTKVGRYVYAVDYGGTGDFDWIHQDKALGSPQGPDQEALRLWISRLWGRDHKVEIQGLYANSGGGALGEAWTVSDPSVSSLTRKALKVSGPVVRERSVTLTWRWDPRDNLFIESGVTLKHLRSEEGKKTASRIRVGMRLGWRF